MEVSENIASVMRMLMEKRGKSLTEFSEELEISRSTLQEYLSGKGNPSAAMLEHIAKKLGVSAAFLISGALGDEPFEILQYMLSGLRMMEKLSPEKLKQFTKLLLEMISLWDSSDEDG